MPTAPTAWTRRALPVCAAVALAAAPPARPPPDLCGALYRQPFDDRSALEALAATPTLVSECSESSMGYSPSLSANTPGPAVVLLLVTGGLFGGSRPGSTTPLRLAVTRGAAPVVAALLARGAAPGAPDAEGRTPIHAALAALGEPRGTAEGDPLATAAALLAVAGRPPGESPLNDQEVGAILAWPEAADLVCPGEPPPGWRLAPPDVLDHATCTAIEARDRALLARALACGARPDGSCAGQDAIVRAAHHGEDAMVELLNAAAERERRPGLPYGLDLGLANALRDDDVPAAATLAALGARMEAGEAARAAAEGDHGDAVRWLSARGLRFDPGSPADAPGPDTTALHVAASSGTAATIDALVAACADVSAVDTAGRTPLALAVQVDHLENTQALLDAGSPIGSWAADTIRYPYGRNTPAIAAALIEGGARVPLPVRRFLHKPGQEALLEHLRTRPRPARRPAGPCTPVPGTDPPTGAAP